jgi:hypothetical protein
MICMFAFVCEGGCGCSCACVRACACEFMRVCVVDCLIAFYPVKLMVFGNIRRRLRLDEEHARERLCILCLFN